MTSGPKEDAGYVVPAYAKAYFHMSGANFLKGWDSDFPDAFKDANGSDEPYEFMEYDTLSVLQASLGTDGAMQLDGASSGWNTGAVCTHGVPMHVPGKEGEAILYVSFDGVLNTHTIGVAAGLSLYSTSYLTPWSVIRFRGATNCLQIGVTGDTSDSRVAWYNNGDSAPFDSLYNSASIGGYAKTVRNTYTFKIVMSHGSTHGLRVIFMVNGVTKKVSDLIKDADLEGFEKFSLHPYIQLYSTDYATPLELYQLSVTRS